MFAAVIRAGRPLPGLVRCAVCMLIVFLLHAPLAHATKKVALVIGNVEYPGKEGRLPNAGADARAVAHKLKGMGFDLVTKGLGAHESGAVLNADPQRMNQALEMLKQGAAGADVVLFYYAGHGVGGVTDVRGEKDSWLQPSGTRFSDEADVRRQGVSLSWVADKLSLPGGGRLRVLIIDACRSHPLYASRGPGERGFDPVRSPEGTLIAYAAASGQSALEQHPDKPHGLYTGVLLDYLDRPGLELRKMFNLVGKEVTRLRKGQTPVMGESAFYDDVYLAGEVRERVPAEQQAFREAQALDTAEGWRHYLSLHGEGGNAKAARTKLEAAERAEAAEQAKRVAEAWRTAQQSDTVEGYEGFLGAHGTSSFASAAKQKLEAARARQPKHKVGDVFRDCAQCPEMVVLPSGSFERGDLHGDGYGNEKPVRTVKIAQPFAIGKYEVTQGEWRAVMGSNPSRFQDCGDRCPVEEVSWDEVQAFIGKLNEKTGKDYRLPSEAEWEYACRAGGRHKWCGSDNEDAVAWHYENSGDKPHAVGGKRANAWGLHDMSGNVYEWVQDCYEEGYDKGQPEDGRAHGPSTNCARRVFRGGGWSGGSRSARSALRYGGTPGVRDDYLGFRLSRTLP